MDAQQDFRDEVDKSPVNIPRAALLFAREIAYPSLDIGAYLDRLDQLAIWARAVVNPSSAITYQATALSKFLFQKFGFQGNSQNYADPRNSYLNEVLDRCLGIPITLSIVYVTLAQRLGIPAWGVGLPGHFIVGVQGEEGSFYLDPFHQGTPLTIASCMELVQKTTGLSGPFQLEWLEPSPPHETLARMLNNLRNAHLQQEDWAKACVTIEHLRILQPDIHDHLRDLAIIHHKQGSFRQAVLFYEQYLSRAPGASDEELIRQQLRAAAAHLARLN